MAKQQSFADKANKKAQKSKVVICPDTGKETRIITVRLVDSVTTDRGTVKFMDRNVKVYETTYKPYTD